jgi:hypothetical protein
LGTLYNHPVIGEEHKEKMRNIGKNKGGRREAGREGMSFTHLYTVNVLTAQRGCLRFYVFLDHLFCAETCWDTIGKFLKSRELDTQGSHCGTFY